MALVQAELEDLAFSCTSSQISMPGLRAKSKRSGASARPYIDAVCRTLQEEMERAGIHAEVQAWQKHLASINRKLQQSGGEVEPDP